MAAFEELGNVAVKSDGVEAPTNTGGGDDDQNFDEWIVEELEHLSLDPEVYQTYVKGIMDDADTSLEERAQSVLDMLSGATEEDLTDFGSNLRTMWELEELRAQNLLSEAAATPSADAAEYMKRLEEDKQVAQAALDRQAEEMANRQVDRHEARGREALLSRYAAVGDGLDEEGNVIACAEVAKADVGLSHMLGANTNKTRVQEEARAMRDKAKADHALKVARDKEQLLREAMRKEKEKRRTQKKEKQRGCG